MNKKQTGITQGLKMLFGIFMVIVYLGMAALLAANVFDWSAAPQWKAVRWFFVVVFAAYGLFRGYRELKGEHSYGMRIMDDDSQDEANQYSTYTKQDKNTTGNEKK